MRECAQRFDSRQKMKKKNYEVFHYRDPKPNGVEVHDHDFYEVYFLLMGDVSYWVEGQTYHLQPGDFLLINPTVLHRPIVAESTSTYERIVLWIDKEYLDTFTDENISLKQCFIKTDADKTNLVRTSSAIEQAELTSYLARLVRESYGNEYANSLYADGVFLQFMVELNRIVLNSAREKEGGDESSTLISNVLNYIGEHYAEDLSLEDLASRFFVSKYHLSHEFRDAVGTGVYRYIMLKRLSAAKQLLSENVLAGEVCYRCGFKDYTNFYRAFKAEYGISPKEVKK